MRNYILAGFIGLAIVVGGIGAWSVSTSIQGAVIANGVTTVESHSKAVQHREGGIISQIAVKDGDRVEAGDVLVKLDETEIQSQLAIIEDSLAALLASSARLKAQRDDSETITFPDELLAKADNKKIREMMEGQKHLFETQRAARKGRTEQLEARIKQLDEQIGGIKSEIEARKDQVKLISQEIVSLDKLLKKGLVPVSRLLALRREKSNLQGQEGELVSRIAQAKSRIGETRLQIIQLDDDDRSKILSELRDTEAKIAELRERAIATSSRLKRMVIRAPKSGFVHQLAIHTIGGVITPGQTVMLIVPELDNLVVEARVNPKDIDQVKTGQKARIRFPSFSSRITPEINAVVYNVSPDLTRPDNNQPPFYSIKIRMNKKELARLGKKNKLIPGMPAEAFIQTKSRSPMNYLIKPLLDQINRVGRER